MTDCCKTGFSWDGKPVGKESTLAGNKAYVTGTNKDVAILLIHDIFGWTFPNARLLADHYAKEADSTVFLPDYFDGDVVIDEMLDEAKRAKFDVMGFIGKHSKDIRGPEMEAAAKALREEHGFKKVGAIGFCYGGWAVFRLGAKENKGLVDCISTSHPSLLTKEEVAAVGVPVQICAPEHDPAFSQELKDYCNEEIPKLGVEYDYQYFPGLSHGFATRGDQTDAVQKKGLERAKNAAVHWFQQHLH